MFGSRRHSGRHGTKISCRRHIVSEGCSCLCTAAPHGSHLCILGWASLYCRDHFGSSAAVLLASLIRKYMSSCRSSAALMSAPRHLLFNSLVGKCMCSCWNSAALFLSPLRLAFQCWICKKDETVAEGERGWYISSCFTFNHTPFSTYLIMYFFTCLLL